MRGDAASSGGSPLSINTEDRRFFIEPGQHIANLRKTHDVTQVTLAESLGVSQQAVQAYEVGRRRIAVSALPAVAKVLEVPLDELFGLKIKPKRGDKRGPHSQLERNIERIHELPKSKPRFVNQMLETVLAQAGSQAGFSFSSYPVQRGLGELFFF